MGFAMLLALGITALVLFLIIYRVMKPEPELDPYSGVTGTTATLLNLSADDTQSDTGSGAIQVRPRAASASSILEASNTRDYRATNLLDGDLATAWNEGVPGPGIGEWVRLEFSRPLVLDRLELANGYQQDADRFYANGRVKSLELVYSSGATQLVELLDEMGYQKIEPAVRETEWIELVIVSVYPGRAWDDTALSEVRVYEAVSQL